MSAVSRPRPRILEETPIAQRFPSWPSPEPFTTWHCHGRTLPLACRGFLRYVATARKDNPLAVGRPVGVDVCSDLSRYFCRFAFSLNLDDVNRIVIIDDQLLAVGREGHKPAQFILQPLLHALLLPVGADVQQVPVLPRLGPQGDCQSLAVRKPRQAVDLVRRPAEQ